LTMRERERVIHQHSTFTRTHRLSSSFVSKSLPILKTWAKLPELWYWQLQRDEEHMEEPIVIFFFSSSFVAFFTMVVHQHNTHPFLHLFLRATLDKDPGTKSPQTNLKHIEPWIGPFITFLKTLFPKLQWVCLKAWGPIWELNIKNVRLTYERIRLIFFFCLFFSFFMIFLIFYFHFHFTWRAENVFFSNYLVRKPTKPPMSIL